MSSKQLVIITDLDGTLLDHHSYSFAPASGALALIAERDYPLILNSSKTREEMLALQSELGFRQPLPFICENGAAVYLPEGDGWRCHPFANLRSDWLPWVHQQRDQHHYPFEGFSDWSAEQIAEITGLPLEKATRAAQRQFSEPLLWRGSDQQREQFSQAIAEQGLRLVRGGRFYSLQGQFDKAEAMLWLRDYYTKQQTSTKRQGGAEQSNSCTKGEVVTIALGDSPNDQAMLNAADIAVVIKSAQSAAINVTSAGRLLRTEQPGPQGWQWAITKIITELDGELT